ncbi:hypothetical protein PMIN06_007688 [Paraphaeosphaeria minitans]
MHIKPYGIAVQITAVQTIAVEHKIYTRKDVVHLPYTETLMIGLIETGPCYPIPKTSIRQKPIRDIVRQQCSE